MNAVDEAMLNASVGEFNLVKVSSILPKNIDWSEEISEEHGDFLPAVISRATGTNEELASGIAWGFEKRGSGGFVMEHSVKGEDIDKERFLDELKEKLRGMAEARGTSLESINMRYCTMEVGKDEYGCTMSVLVYLP